MMQGNSLFLLLAGVSGVGKTTVMQELKVLDKRFKYISPDMTRSLRDGEADKNYVPTDDLLAARDAGRYLIVNHINKVYYATPKETIINAFNVGDFPLLDFPIEKTNIISNFVEGKVFIAYMLPPSIQELKARLSYDNRDKEGLRLKAASAELNKYHNHEYDDKIDLHIVSETGQAKAIAIDIYTAFLSKLR